MRSVAALAQLAALVALAAADPGLRDHPIESSQAPLYLDGAWTASSGAPLNGAAAINISVPAWVPGDLLTDLQKAGVIPDPWLDITWIANSSLWTEHEWTYTTHFSVESSAALAGDSALRLVFDGAEPGGSRADARQWTPHPARQAVRKCPRVQMYSSAPPPFCTQGGAVDTMVPPPPNTRRQDGRDGAGQRARAGRGARSVPALHLPARQRGGPAPRTARQPA